MGGGVYRVAICANMGFQAVLLALAARGHFAPVFLAIHGLLIAYAAWFLIEERR